MNSVIGEGYLSRTDINLTYAYQWKLSKKENSPTLAFGLQGGLMRRYVDKSAGYYYLYEAKYYPNLDAGIHFYLPNQKFYASFAMMSFLYPYNHPKYPYYIFEQPYAYYQMLIGYRIDIGKNTFLQPNLYIKTSLDNDIINPSLQLQRKKWDCGINYNYNYSLGGNAGVCIAKRFYIRLAYDYITLKGYNQGNSTLMLAYRSLK